MVTPPPYGGYAGTPPPGAYGAYAGAPPPGTYAAYPPGPQATMQYQQLPGGQTAVITTIATTGTSSLRETPATVTCQYCHNTTITQTEYKSGLLTWAICCGVSFFGCIFGCCLIPFFVDSTKVRSVRASERVPGLRVFFRLTARHDSG